MLLTTVDNKYAFSAVTLLIGRQEGHPQWGAGMVICLERGADLHMAQLIPLPLIVSCFSKIQIGFTFLVPAHPGSPGQRAVKRLCVCVRACVRACVCVITSTAILTAKGHIAAAAYQIVLSISTDRQTDRQTHSRD